jgi:tRNA dimethylallyltransferase
MSAPPAPLLLAGPTAVGKTEVSLLLAERLGAELVSVDSMQVYRGLDIGTAKPSLAERQRVPHHLIDVVGLSETVDAARFVELARAAVRDIQARGRAPLLSGGTGFYFKAYLEGLGAAPAPDPALRAQLEQTPLPDLLRELAEGDPATFARIDRQNPRRVVRALEVLRLAGKPVSTLRAPWRGPGSGGAPGPLFFGLSRRREDLCQRIARRVEEQFRQGVVAETQRAMAQGLAQNRTAMQSIVYRQVVEYLQGQRSLPDTLELIKARNRQYAKRQMTWFRRQARVAWLEIPPAEPAKTTAERLLEKLKTEEWQER